MLLANMVYRMPHAGRLPFPLQGPASELAAAAPGLLELDVTSNLVSSWQFAVDAVGALPALEVLNLSANALCLARPAAPPTLPGLRALVLNNCGVAWQDVRHPPPPP